MAFRIAALLVAGVFAGASPAGAQTATQVVRFQVNAINQMAVSEDPAPLVIKTATAGSAPTSATSDASYSVTTNQTNQKITASIDAPMPAGLTLEVAVAAPDGAASTGPVPLGTAAADVVTGISGTSASALPITYRLSATPTAGVSTSSERVVTFTIVAGS